MGAHYVKNIRKNPALLHVGVVLVVECLLP